MMTINQTQRLAGLGATKSPLTRPYDAYLNDAATPGFFEQNTPLVVGVVAVVTFGLGWLFRGYVA